MASLSRWMRKPDWALALVFAALVLPAAIPDTIIGLVDSYDDAPFKYRPGTLMLLYIVLECARKRRPLTGAVVAAFTLALAVLVLALRDVIRQGNSPDLYPSEVLAVVAMGAVLGATIAGIGWFFEWLVRRPPVAYSTQRPEPVSVRPSGVVTVMALAMVLCLLAESAGWAVQAGVGFDTWLGFYLQDSTGWYATVAAWRVVQTLVQLDRLVVVALASLATYAMLKRWRAARGLIVAWGLVALALAVARVMFFRRLGLPDALGGAVRTSEYTFVNLYMARPALPAPVLFDVMRLEVPVRAALCALGVPYVLLSKRLKEYLGKPRPGSATPPSSIPDQT
jgi:hypothetical protein